MIFTLVLSVSLTVPIHLFFLTLTLKLDIATEKICGDEIALAAELTRIRGRLVIAGYHQDGPRQVNMQLWNWRGLDVINAHERDETVYVSGMHAAVDAVTAGHLDPGPLFTHTLPLEEIAAAFALVAERPDGFLKALIRCD